MLVLALVVLAVLSGSVMAAQSVPTAESTQNVNAVVPGYTVTLTAPVDVSGWNLERGINNEKDVGPVLISTTAPSTWKMHLAIAADGKSLHDSTPKYLETDGYLSVITPPVPDVIGATGWEQLKNGNIITVDKDASLTPVSIPVRLRQYVTPSDDSGDYTIALTYTLSVTST